MEHLKFNQSIHSLKFYIIYIEIKLSKTLSFDIYVKRKYLDIQVVKFNFNCSLHISNIWLKFGTYKSIFKGI